MKYIIKLRKPLLKDELQRLTRRETKGLFLPINEFIKALFSTHAGIAVINRMVQRFEIAVIKVNIYTILLEGEMDSSLLEKMKDAKEELDITLDEMKDW